MKIKYYLEDLNVGQKFSSDTHLVNEAQIIDFASQYDPQPFHLEKEAAKNSFFGELVASGWHTASITMKLLVNGDLKIANGVIGAGAEVHWPAPTRPGDVLRVEGEVLEISPSRSKPDRGMVKIRCETINQRQEVVQRFIANLLVLKKSV